MMRKLLVVLGVPVDNITMDEALDRCDEFVARGRATGRTHQIATVNADFVVNSLHDPELRRILQEADLATADGMPLVWASRLLGGPLPGRVTGADLVPALAERAAERGYSIYFLGAREGVAARAAEILVERHPALKVAGVYSPPPSSVLEMDRAVMERVVATKPDILLVAFGNPKQEKWIRMYAPELHIPVCIGIGGTLDMIVGVTKRAPVWMQRTGLEWFYRLAQEPRRLLKRYFHDFAYFGYFFARQWWAMRRGTAVSMAPVEGVSELPAPSCPPVVAEAPTPAEAIAPDAPAAPPAPAPMPVLPLRGRLDVTNYEPFIEQARGHLDAGNSLTIEMSRAEFLDSTALGALVALANQARAMGQALYLVAVPKIVADLLALVKLDRFFEQLPTLAAAEERRATPDTPSEPQPAPGGWTVVRAPRIFDAGTAPLLLERCEQRIAELPRLLIDMTDTVFLASAGMAALLRLDRAAREHGGELRVAGCSPDVLRTLKLVKLDAILNVFPTPGEAMSAVPLGTGASLPGSILPLRQ
jgi:N-acetylglucosaminyldiphosphoundecaprenol N-acetyl-beta-D-mannosaminyltransferase